MGSFDWQTWIALAFVLAAAAFLVRRVYRLVKGNAKSGCDSGCGSCSTGAASKQEGRQLPLVTLDERADEEH